MDKSFFEWIFFLVTKYKDLYISGTLMTLLIATVGTLLGFFVGFAMGIIQSVELKECKNRIQKCVYILLKSIMKIYTTIFRGTPMMVQAMVIFYGSSQLFDINMHTVAAAILVLTLNTGAYMAESVRGGIQSIDRGQIEAAKALGMSQGRTMLSIVLPQAIRNIMPQMGNFYVINIKDTSILNIISVTELFYTTKTVATTYYKYFEAYLITAVIYLVLTIVTNWVLKHLEKFMAGRDNYKLVDESTLVPMEN